MRDLSQLRLEQFEGRVGEPFLLTAADGAAPPLQMRLTEVSALHGAPAEGVRAPFSIVFTGPADPMLPQAIYRFEHQELGALELFVVPLGPDAGGPRYEAVFT